MRNFVICGLSGCKMFFSHYFINGTLLQKKVIKHKICVLTSSTILSVTFITIIIYERDMINVYCIHVKYLQFLSELNNY